MSIFSAISIASSTSMPRYLTVLSIFECPSKVAPLSNLQFADRSAPPWFAAASAYRTSLDRGRYWPPTPERAGILPRRQSTSAATTDEKKLTRFTSRQAQALVDCLSSFVGQLEAHRPTSLLLPDSCAIHRVTAWNDIIDADGNDIEAA